MDSFVRSESPRPEVKLSKREDLMKIEKPTTRPTIPQARPWEDRENERGDEKPRLKRRTDEADSLNRTIESLRLIQS